MRSQGTLSKGSEEQILLVFKRRSTEILTFYTTSNASPTKRSSTEYDGKNWLYWMKFMEQE